MFKLANAQLLRHRVKHRLSSGSITAGFSPRRNISIISTVGEQIIKVHEISGLPWIVLVPIVTFGLRSLTTLPLSIWQRQRLIKQQELGNVVKATPPVVKARLAAYVNSSAGKRPKALIPGVKPSQLTPEHIRLLAMKETRRRQKRLYKKNGVQLWKNMLLPLVQVPLWITLSLGLRQLTGRSLEETNEIPWPLDLIDGLAGWELSMPLTSHFLWAPVVLGSLTLANIEILGRISGAAGNPAKLSGAILRVSRLGAVFMMAAASQAPIILSLYWISSQFYSLVQNILLNYLWPLDRQNMTSKDVLTTR